MTESKKEPAELEETSDTVDIVYAGKTYTLPASLEDVSGDVLEAIDERKLSFAIRELLGPDQFRTFKATKPKVRAYGELFEAYANAIGLESLEN